jgi:predicted O-methyltransferase YrrM
MEEKLKKLYATFRDIEVEYFESLKRISEQAKPKRILELGSGWGISGSAFLLGSPEATMISIDRIPLNTLTDFRWTMDLFGFWERVKYINGVSYEVIKTLDGKFDLIYIDASHRYVEVMQDLSLSVLKVNEGGCIVMDDFWHKNNWEIEPKNRQEMNYGVFQAVKEWSFKNQKPFTVYPSYSGIVKIDL